MGSMIRSLCIILIVLSVGGCDKMRSPTGPTPLPGLPDQSRYDPLPYRQRIMDRDTGNETKMWVELVGVDPPRGSKIRPYPELQRCFDNDPCFRANVILGLDEPSNIHVVAFFTIFFSGDGITALGSGSPWQYGAKWGEYPDRPAEHPKLLGPRLFMEAEAPKWLVICGGPSPILPDWAFESNRLILGGQGCSQFELGYK